MPLYEYQCEKCGHRFEKIQRLSDPPPEACPVCGGAVHKMQSAPAFQFKGSGWYITDYAKSGSRDSKDSKDHTPASSSAPASETKTDAPKTETKTKTETKSE